MNLRFALYFLVFLVLKNFVLFAQKTKGITFEIEKLEHAINPIPEIGGRDAALSIAPQLLVHSPLPDSLVYLGVHPFFNGMYKAYADHRPFELSPDMIWLLICQGFAQHVNNNAKELRHLFVNFDGKKTLVVRTEIDPTYNLLAWETIIGKLCNHAAEQSTPELFTTLTPNFSTTTPVTKVATQITALESMKAYFEYIVIFPACGIPEITLTGTPDDWKTVLRKAKELRKYKLEWWIDEIVPQLEEFVLASEGKVNKTHWQNMFKFHTKKVYGAPKVIDGWIVKFFPYNNDRTRNNLSTLESSNSLPDEQISVDFKLIKLYPEGRSETLPLTFIAGFTGLRQNPKTMCLTPEISWMVANKKSSMDVKPNQKDTVDRIDVRVSEIPLELLSFKAIDDFRVEFIDSIIVPVELTKMSINNLGLYGKITSKEEQRIVKLFPNSELYINDNAYHTKKYLEEDKALWKELREMAESKEKQ